MGLKPHAFKPVCYGVPTIHLSEQAAHDMWQIVDLSNKEVGWLGTVVRRDDGDFLIEDIFLMKQEVASTTTELTPEGIADVVTRLVQEDVEAGVETNDPNFRSNKLLFWGHSHVHMDTGASGQDDNQMGHFRENGSEYFIRGILNKKGKAQFTIYFFEPNLVLHDVEWDIETHEDASRREFWKNQIQENVSDLKVRYTSKKSHKNSTWSGYYGNNWPYGNRPYGGRFRG